MKRAPAGPPWASLLCGLAIGAGVAAGSATASPMPQAPESAPSLPGILTTMAEVAGLYRDQALSFTCLEQIRVTRYDRRDRPAGRESHRFDYFYVFRDAPHLGLESGLEESRAEIDTRGLAERPTVDLERLGIPTSLSRAYSWIFVFQPALERYYEFALEGEDEALGRPAWVVSFAPRQPYYEGVNDWFGRVWIDRRDHRLLRAEAAKSSDFVRRQDPRLTPEQRREQHRQVGGRNDMAPLDFGRVSDENDLLFSWTVAEFDETHQGLRFPTHTELILGWVELGEDSDKAYRESIADVLERGIRRDRVVRIEQRYEEYRYFRESASMLFAVGGRSEVGKR